jgi:hypothetical protein
MIAAYVVLTILFVGAIVVYAWKHRDGHAAARLAGPHPQPHIASMFVNPLHQSTVTDIALLDVEYEEPITPHRPESRIVDVDSELYVAHRGARSGAADAHYAEPMDHCSHVAFDAQANLTHRGFSAADGYATIAPTRPPEIVSSYSVFRSEGLARGVDVTSA